MVEDVGVVEISPDDTFIGVEEVWDLIGVVAAAVVGSNIDVWSCRCLLKLSAVLHEYVQFEHYKSGLEFL